MKGEDNSFLGGVIWFACGLGFVFVGVAVLGLLVIDLFCR